MSIFRKRQKSKKMKVLACFVVPMACFLSFLFVYWWTNDFWTYAQLMLFNQQQEQEQNYNNEEEEDAEGVDSYFTGGDSSTRGNSSGGGASSGGMGYSGGGGNTSSGLNLALMNSMQEGYAKDYLEIVRDHVNYEYMNLGTSGDTDLNVFTFAGEQVQFGINDILGISYCESAAYGSGNYQGFPKCLINMDYYGLDVGGTKLNLYTATSEFVIKNGTQYVSDYCSYDKSNLRTSKDRASYTQFQFSKGFFTKYPSGTYDAGIESKKDSYPSTLVPGSYNKKDPSRGMEDRDAMYFPDQLSAAMRSCMGRAKSAIKEDVLTPEAKEIFYSFCYPLGHHWGGNSPRLGVGRWHFPDNADKSMYADGVTHKEGVALAINQMTPLYKKAVDWFNSIDDPDSVDFNFSPGDYGSFLGLGDGLLLFGCNGFLRTEAGYNALVSDVSRSEYGERDYSRGMIVAYKIITGNDIDFDGIRSWVSSNKSKILKTNLDGYCAPETEFSKNYSPYIYTLDNNRSVTYPGQSKSVPLLHCWDKVDVRGIFKHLMAGYYGYYIMLKSSGVDCTFKEVMSDGGTGDLIEEIPMPQSQKVTDFYRGLTMYNGDGSVNAESIVQLRAQLSAEILGGEVIDSKKFTYNSQELKSTLRKAQSTLCPYHITNKYNTAGSGSGYPSARLNDLPNPPFATPSYLQCTWWATGRGREYLEYYAPQNIERYPNGWGNGGHYNEKADAVGFQWGTEPKPGSLVDMDGSKYRSHIGFVEAVDAKTGDIWVSDCGSGNLWWGLRIPTQTLRDFIYISEPLKW